MGRVIRLSDFARMSPKEREERIAKIVSCLTSEERAEYYKDVLSVLVWFEQRHGMTSQQMDREVCEGTLGETAEISRWRFWLYLQREFQGHLGNLDAQLHELNLRYQRQLASAKP